MMLLIFFVERTRMKTLKEEVNELKIEKKSLDQRIKQEKKELDLLKDEGNELKIRLIVLEELLKKY